MIQKKNYLLRLNTLPVYLPQPEQRENGLCLLSYYHFKLWLGGRDFLKMYL